MNNATSEPRVGLGATINYWTDRQAATIISVSNNGKTVKVQEDKTTFNEAESNLKRIPGGFVAHTYGKQVWDCEPDPQGEIRDFSLRKNGKFVAVGEPMNGTSLTIGVRSHFHDYNF